MLFNSVYLGWKKLYILEVKDYKQPCGDIEVGDPPPPPPPPVKN